ncbi:MAG: dCTP deaminase [Gammaproteobacteria bacterium]|nr:dCTP deaminase [Gammaproteobacteria bacterium]
MGIKSDTWIRRMALEQKMIEPFEPGQVRRNGGGPIVSYGTSSYGYDIRCSDEFKIFTNINSTIVDPKNFDAKSFVDFKGDVCIIPPNSFALARTVEYFRVPRNVLVLCLGKSTYARCFRGDQRVALVDGSSVALEDMARRSEQGEVFWGYSIGVSGAIIVTRLEAPRWIGRDALIEIELDSGESIRSTPDHVFIRRDGSAAAAADLRRGDCLMPLYRDVVHGKEAVYQPISGQRMATRRLVSDWDLRHGSGVAGRQTARQHPGHDWHDRHRGDRAYGSAARAARQPVRSVGPDQAAFRLSPELISAFSARPGRNHRIEAVRELPGDHDVYCLTVPEAGNFALEAGVFVSNCGIIVNVTPLEPEWEGHVTLEFSNTTPLPAKIYANEGVAQVIFIDGDEVCEVSYRDRGGKYQGQTGVTLPKT